MHEWVDLYHVETSRAQSGGMQNLVGAPPLPSEVRRCGWYLEIQSSACVLGC